MTSPTIQAAGEYAFLELKEITAAAQELDLMTGSVISNWSYAGEHDVQVVTLTDADTDTVSTRFTAPAAMGLTVQLAFCNLASNGAACTLFFLFFLNALFFLKYDLTGIYCHENILFKNIYIKGQLPLL